MKATLEETLKYQNDAIVHRFIETWELPLEDAQDIFDQMKKWLWLQAYEQEKSDTPIRLAISQSTKLIDEMWHTFILFTPDYHRFCEQHFGFYVHHNPTPKAEYGQQISAYESDPESYMEKQKERFTAQYELIYDVLGEDTLVKWYDEYLDKYTDEYLRQIWRWSFSPYDTRVRESLRLDNLSDDVSGNASDSLSA